MAKTKFPYPFILILALVVILALIFTKTNFLQQIKNFQPSITITPQPNINYTLSNSEGSCNQDTDCQWAGEGCGGGHGVCTNTPEKYQGSYTTCDVNPSFPANQGFSCGCVASLGKCGWKR